MIGSTLTGRQNCFHISPSSPSSTSGQSLKKIRSEDRLRCVPLDQNLRPEPAAPKIQKSFQDGRVVFFYVCVFTRSCSRPRWGECGRHPTGCPSRLFFIIERSICVNIPILETQQDNLLDTQQVAHLDFFINERSFCVNILISETQ